MGAHGKVAALNSGGGDSSPLNGDTARFRQRALKIQPILNALIDQSFIFISGVFILNLVCRNTSLRDKVLSDLHTVFPELYSIRIEGEVNEIVIALPQPRYQTEGEDKKSQETLKALFRNSVAELQKQAKGQGHSWDPSLDLCELVQSVQIV